MINKNENDKRVQNYIEMQIRSAKLFLENSKFDYSSGSVIRQLVEEQYKLSTLELLREKVQEKGFEEGIKYVVDILNSNLINNRYAPNSNYIFANAINISRQYVATIILRELRDIQKLYIDKTS